MQEHEAGDLESAKSLYKEILSQTPNDPDVLNLFGVLCLQCKDLNRACDLIQQAIDIDPQIAGYHYNLGQVLCERGEIKGATACYHKALALDPTLCVARERLNILDQSSSAIISDTQNSQIMMRYEVIQHVIDRIKGKVYLEIGVDSGKSFINTRAAKKIGVDPVPTPQLVDQALESCNIEYLGLSTAAPLKSTELTLAASIKKPVAQMDSNESMQLFYSTSDAFFKNNAAPLFCTEKIDVAFVDGLHTYEQTTQDVLNVLGHLKDDGIILIHDCNPPTATSALPATSWNEVAQMALPGWDGMWCGDVWKTIVHLRSTRDDLNIFVLDCDFGIGVVSKGAPTNGLNYSADQIGAMDFDDLDKNRHSLLNLKNQNYLFEFLNTIGRDS